MRKLYYDFHIHSCLSPCADDDMTPANIVNMAKLKGLDAIAVTDHNSLRNCKAACHMAQQEGILFLPGVELCTSEETHILCLFEDMEGALAFQDYIDPLLPDIKNRTDIFGKQIIMDENDEVAGFEERLLINAVAVSVENLQGLLEAYGGVAIPAHIDRDSYSLYNSLGSIPEECGFSYIELSSSCRKEFLAAHDDLLKGFGLLKNSDAHELSEISEAVNFILLEKDQPTTRDIVNMLKKAPA